VPRTRLKQAIAAERLFDGDAWLTRHAIIISDGYIEALLPTAALPSGLPLVNLPEGTLAPGLIDLQVNGGGGVMFNNELTVDGLTTIAAAHRRCGTTTIMPTLISDTPDAQRAAATAVDEAVAAGNAGILGLHIEGPFFDPARRGTHKAEMIRSMEAADLEWLCEAREFPLMVTLAPEHLAPGQISALADAGILVCAGHTSANHDRIRSAIAEGLRGFTHLFNAMSALTAREPGTVGAALDDADTWAGIIADGHHVHPVTIRLAQRAKRAGKLMLVSDAMSTVGSDANYFEIYGERIEESDGRLVNAECNLAGSAISLLDAVRYSHLQVGLELGECLRMASLYPAEFLGLEHRLGRIQAGYRADLVCFDENFAATDTWLAGAHLTPF